jgi:hypothetical protein
MNYILLDNSVVVQTIVKNSHVTTGDYEGYYDTVIEDPSAQFKIGDVYSLEQWELYNLTEQERFKKLVPNSISMRQARLQLLEANLLDTVEATVANDRAMQIEWEYVTELERNNSLVFSLATVLNLTEQQLDELFIAASSK